MYTYTDNVHICIRLQCSMPWQLDVVYSSYTTKAITFCQPLQLKGFNI